MIPTMKQIILKKLVSNYWDIELSNGQTVLADFAT